MPSSGGSPSATRNSTPTRERVSPSSRSSSTETSREERDRAPHIPDQEAARARAPDRTGGRVRAPKRNQGGHGAGLRHAHHRGRLRQRRRGGAARGHLGVARGAGAGQGLS